MCCSHHILFIPPPGGCATWMGSVRLVRISSPTRWRLLYIYRQYVAARQLNEVAIPSHFRHTKSGAGSDFYTVKSIHQRIPSVRHSSLESLVHGVELGAKTSSSVASSIDRRIDQSMLPKPNRWHWGMTMRSGWLRLIERGDLFSFSCLWG